MSGRIVRKMVVAGCLFAGLGLGGVSASAGHPCYWKTVVEYVPVEKSYIDYVVKYKPCGTPYKVAVTRTKIVKVAVEKRIKVCPPAHYGY